MPYKDIDKRRAHCREYYTKNRIRILAVQKAKQKTPEARQHASSWRKKHYQDNPDIYWKYALRSKGISIEIYNALFDAQLGKCAICLKEPNGQRLAIDHDHETGKIRGLLCKSCNLGLGFIKEIQYLDNAIVYLNKHPVMNYEN